MKKMLLILFFSSFALFAQEKSIWKKIEEKSLKNEIKVKRNNLPKEFDVWRLNLNNLKAKLANAPLRGEYFGLSNVVIELPNFEGKLERFRVLETQIMEQELAEKFPTIKSYVGLGIDNPAAVARFSVTEFGLHSMTLSPDKSTAFIDPYTENRENYIVYSRASLGADNQTFECLTDESIHLPSLEKDRRNINAFRADTDDKKLRTYRLAQSCTAEYGNLFRGNTADPISVQKGRIQAQMAITMTRVNGVYENDLAITMIFIANNDLLIYLGATNSDPWINEYNVRTGETIDANVGFNNYDIGHNFNTSGGGNAGCIGCVCSPSTNPSGGFHKGTGMTGRSNPTGDAFDIDYVAHEMGHQFGGYHVQSSSNCRSGSGLTEVEPGSGSTIMGYAGICATNVQSNSDAYFAYVNIRDILENVKNGVSSSCAQITNLSNNPPVANAGEDYVIPRSTAFMLVGEGSDPDSDPITYNWEQNDPGNPNSSAAPSATRIVGPMFRSLNSSTSPIRYMPNMTTVLSGGTSNTWEVCPSVARDLNFSFTVRDNNSGIGQVATDLMKVTVDGASGPFVVNVPNTNVNWQAGTNQIVTWNKANSDLPPVNAKFVDILLSTNGGTSFDILLASKVPNDGSETVTIPNIVGTTNRIMVKGWNNIFFDVSNSNFTISAPSSTFSVAFNGVAGEQNKEACQGTSVSYTIPYMALNGFSGTTSFTVSGHPVGSTVTFSPTTINTNGNVTMTISNTAASTTQFYSMVVTASSGTTKTVPFYLNLVSGNFGTQMLTSPANLAVGQSTTSTLTWPANAAATMYDIEVATDIAFTNIFYAGTVTSNTVTVSGLTEATDYYWRVKPRNTGCEGTFSASYTFKTGATNCAYNYSNNTALNVPDGVGTPSYGPEVTKTIIVPGTVTGNINSLSVDLSFTHPYVDDLQIWITHPDGTPVYLWNHNCEDEFSSVNVTYEDGNTTIPEGPSCTVANSNGTFAPNTPLSVLAGKPAAGTWVLHARDYWNPDTGVINTWAIHLCVADAALSSENFELTGVTLYPNPNNGVFNLSLNANSGNVKVEVFDTRGRLILNKSISGNGMVNETINLQDVQSGIYLVTIQDGARKITKKIIVE